MRLCVFEDAGVARLEPVAFTRPAFALRSGACSILERQRRAFVVPEVGALVRSSLVELCRQQFPKVTFNDSAFCRRGVILANARWLPPASIAADAARPHVGVCGGQAAYVVLPRGADADLAAETIDGAIDLLRKGLPEVPAGGMMVNFLWDLVDANAELVARDRDWFAGLAGKRRPSGISFLGPAEDLVVDDSATLEPHVVFDTRPGPVLVDRGAIVQAFSRIEGPCYIGPDTWIVGAKVRGGSFGPMCKLGGEIEASIVQGFSNKYHDGFLGHSYVGEWVNLAAGTQTSDLRNDYGNVKVSVCGQRIATGKNKVGSFIGDHTKTGLAALLNTGSSLGVFCNVLPSGSLLPTVVPSFCQVNRGQLRERFDIRTALTTAETVMRRRGQTWSDAHRELCYTLYDQTAEQRRRVLHDAEMHRARHEG